MINAQTQQHDQGGDQHLDEETHAAATRNADRENRGLMPPGMVFEGMWFDVPESSASPGVEGMRAFDEDYLERALLPDRGRAVVQ